MEMKVKDREAILEHLRKASDHLEAAEQLMAKDKEYSIWKAFLNQSLQKIQSVFQSVMNRG